MRASVWLLVLSVAGGMGCSASGTEASDLDAAGAPAGGSVAAAQAGATAAPGGAGGASAGARSAGGAGGSRASSGGSGGAHVAAGASAGGAAASTPTCTDTAEPLTEFCKSAVTEVCAQGSAITWDGYKVNGKSFPCNGTDCTAAAKAFLDYCNQVGAGGATGGTGGAPGSGSAGAPAGGASACDPTDICCADTRAKVLAKACEPGVIEDRTRQPYCADPCVATNTDPAGTEAMCRADNSPLCAWDSTAACWKCMP